MLVVNAQLGVKNIDELCALSKAKAGTLSYLAPGAPLVLYMETLKKEKGCDWVRVPFKGGGEAVNAIMSGSTPIGLFGEGNVIGNIQAGQMTPLVMMNNIRSPNFPKVPLLTEVGYNGPPSRSWAANAASCSFSRCAAWVRETRFIGPTRMPRSKRYWITMR
jgi:tripartite-type tricarboxylate transporter receptor subunit TctC